MIEATHVIITAYGFWLPNDSRGSWSDFVAAWELLRFGKATKVTTRRSVAGASHNRALRLAAKAALKYPPVYFDGLQARAVARGFSIAVDEADIAVHACSILPDHVHLVLGNHERTIESVTAHLKSRATKQLRAEEIHPLERFSDADGRVPGAWARKLRKVFCFDLAHVENAIRYVEFKPGRQGKTDQSWSVVSPRKPTPWK